MTDAFVSRILIFFTLDPRESASLRRRLGGVSSLVLGDEAEKSSKKLSNISESDEFFEFFI